MASSSDPLCGTITLPGDKSISHRAVLLASLADGRSAITHFLEAEDCLHTVEAMRQLGVEIRHEGDTLIIHGVGLTGLIPSKKPIDCGNAGTLMRLLSGLLAGQPFESTLFGDASLSKRPMNRIIDPLRAMGAEIRGEGDGFPPLRIQGHRALKSIDYHMSVASAQVKSCLLLAGLYTPAGITLTEKVQTRDHTERLLSLFGVSVKKHKNQFFIHPQRLNPITFEIPGDFSSAAFFIAAACLIKGSHLIIKNVGLNPTRLGFLSLLTFMGANICIKRSEGTEPSGEIEVRFTPLKGIEIPEQMVALSIDEFPILFVVASFAEGKTTLRGASELRVKETDRLAVMAENLQSCGVSVELLDDGLIIQGETFEGGTVDSKGDHRIAMAFAIAGCVSKNPVTIHNTECIQTSFPGFLEVAQGLSLNIALDCHAHFARSQ